MRVIKKTGLKTISSVKYQQHNALSDAMVLADIFSKQDVYVDLLNRNRVSRSTSDILQFLEKKPTISINELYHLSKSVNDIEQLACWLKQYVYKKVHYLMNKL